MLLFSVAFLSTLIEIKGTRWMDANPHAADWPNKIHHRNYDEARMSGDKRPLGKLATLAKGINDPRHDKTCLREFPTRPDTNRPAQPQKLARVLKFRL